jgi:hypothetical protein
MLFILFIKIVVINNLFGIYIINFIRYIIGKIYLKQIHPLPNYHDSSTYFFFYFFLKKIL